jgi:predicted nucleotidyltransferase
MRHDDLPQALIFLCLHGSQAYGTATPTSDWDVRGVGIAPLTTYFGTRPWEQIQGGSPFLEQLLYDKHPQANNGDELDSEVFNVTKFVRLAADANPNILDILFAHPDDWLHTTPAWEMLHEKRHMFLSMRVRHTYTGYAMSQLKRIKSHRKWLLEPPKQKPTRTDFGLPESHSLVPKDIQDLAESVMSKKMSQWKLDKLLEQMDEEARDDLRYAMQDYFAMVHGRPFDPNGEHERQQASLQGSVEQELFKRLEAERKYKHALNHWKQYQGWLKQRNAARAKLESQFGYDAKHASHLVRLLLSVQEILTEGNLSVRHPHAQLLRDVRGGAWSYDELIEWANEQEQIIHKLSAEKPLRHSPDRDAIDQLITDMVMTFHGKH